MLFFPGRPQANPSRGLSFVQLLKPEDGSRFEALVTKHAAACKGAEQNLALPFNIHLRGPDGSMVAMKALHMPILQNGRVLHLLGLSQESPELVTPDHQGPAAAEAVSISEARAHRSRSEAGETLSQTVSARPVLVPEDDVLSEGLSERTSATRAPLGAANVDLNNFLATIDLDPAQLTSKMQRRHQDQEPPAASTTSEPSDVDHCQVSCNDASSDVSAFTMSQ